MYSGREAWQCVQWEGGVTMCTVGGRRGNVYSGREAWQCVQGRCGREVIVCMFVCQVREVDPLKEKLVLEQITWRLDKLENDTLPQVDLNVTEVRVQVGVVVFPRFMYKWVW